MLVERQKRWRRKVEKEKKNCTATSLESVTRMEDENTADFLELLPQLKVRFIVIWAQLCSENVR